MEERLRQWYEETYPEDDLGSEIDEEATFRDLYNAIRNAGNVYEIIGVGDSIIRARCFERLAGIIGKDYNYVYDRWLFARGAVA